MNCFALSPRQPRQHIQEDWKEQNEIIFMYLRQYNIYVLSNVLIVSRCKVNVQDESGHGSLSQVLIVFWISKWGAEFLVTADPDCSQAPRFSYPESGQTAGSCCSCSYSPLPAAQLLCSTKSKSTIYLSFTGVYHGIHWSCHVSPSHDIVTQILGPTQWGPACLDC